MIAIVTDSTSYLTKQEAAQLGVRVIPATFTVSGHLFNETFADCNGDYQRLIGQNSGKCQTSQTNIAAFMSAFEELIKDGFDILCITISSRLSGAYSSASIAAREVGGKIAVVDSLSTAGGIYMLLKEAKAMSIAGMGIEEIASQLRSLREKIAIAFSVDDMTALRRSGRLSIVRQSVGTILNIKPLLMCVDGAVISVGTARGRYDQIRQLVERVPKNVSQLLVHYVANSYVAKGIVKELQERYPALQVETRPIGPVLAIHLGLTAVGIAWFEN